TGCSPKQTTSEHKDETGGQAASAADDVPAWLGEPPAISDEDCVETIQTEVLVIGAGCSGLVAANFSAMEGAKTLLIEKYEVGTGLRGSAIGAVGSRKQKEAGVDIDPVEICNDLVHYSLNNSSYDLHRLWADHSAEAVDWYCDLCDGVDQCRIDLEWNMPEQETRYKCWPTGHGAMLDNGKTGKDEASAEGVTYSLIEQNFLSYDNAELRYGTGLECLIKENDRVVGAYASNADGEYLRIDASKGVIVATGGYANNADMFMALQADSAKSLCGVVPFGNFNAQGQGIKACLWAGAVKDAAPTCMIFDRGLMRADQLPGSPFDMDFEYLHMATQPFLKVDIEGDRITNESSPYDFLIHALAQKSEQRAWFDIWDSNWPEDIDRFHTIGCSTLIKREGTNQMDPEGIEGTAAIIESQIEAGKIVKADTLEEIADAFGIDKENFLKTVEEYNALFDAQNDSRYGKEAFRLSELRTPPYYACKLSGIVLCTLDGIEINTDFQALNAEGKPIEGLYVIGNDSGNYYNGTYPNLAAGLNAGRCVTFGMLCGKHVANL
ncbi:MAG: FAD-binding protein, partial [Slackia sp.]